MTTSELYKIFCQHPVVTTDTRNCPSGSIFFALRGASFNGNDFALKALEAGCAYAVVDDDGVVGDERLIHVADVLTALQDLAAHHRRTLGTPIVQITGTNGKTTTKELMAAVLSEKYHVLYTQGNLNNHIGVPLTLLRLKAEHDVAVIETGANHPGEIADLSRIVQADYGLITNVGMAHLEGFGSFEGVIKTKGELYENLRTRSSGFVFLNADNPYLVPLATGITTYTYGLPGNEYDVEGEVCSCTPFLNLRWRSRGSEWREVQTQLIGAYNVTNALAAAAVGTRLGVCPEAVTRALCNYSPSNSRSELRHVGSNTLIVDAYNANPTSMKAALDNFCLIDHPHKMLILGQMGELGEASLEEHRLVAKQAAAVGCEEVWLVGDNFKPYAEACRFFSDVESVEAELRTHPVNNRLILIKGSNSTRLFRLPECLEG